MEVENCEDEQTIMEAENKIEGSKVIQWNVTVMICEMRLYICLLISIYYNIPFSKSSED